MSAGLRARHSRRPRQGKAPVGPNYLSPADSFSQERKQQPELRYRVVDYCGDIHLYPPMS